jgi:hypothetical protein
MVAETSGAAPQVVSPELAKLAEKAGGLGVDGKSLPGAVILVNHGDQNLNAIPDYSDLNFPIATHPVLVPMSLKIIPGPKIDWDKVTVVFEYDGLTTDNFKLEMFNGTELDSVPFPAPTNGQFPIGKDGINKATLGDLVQMRDFSPAKQKTLRIWKTPPKNRTDQNRMIDDYIAPGEKTKGQKYTAKELGFPAANDTVLLYLEGINAKADVPIKVKVLCKDASTTVQVVEPNLGINNSNTPIAGSDGMRLLRAGVPDVPFLIDEHLAEGQVVADDRTPGPKFAHDEMVEDQGDGFRFWWAHDRGEKMIDENVTDWAPIAIDLPKELLNKGFKFSLEMKLEKADPNVQLVVGRALKGAKDNRRAFLQEKRFFEAQQGQINAKNGVIVLTGADPIKDVTDFLGNTAGRHQLLCKANYILKAPGVQPKVKVVLKMRVTGPDGKVTVPADQFVLTLMQLTKFYALYSVRADAIKTGKGPANDKLKPPAADARFYPIDEIPKVQEGLDAFTAVPDTEGGTPAKPLRYPDAQILDADARDQGKKNYFVSIHGFNVDLKDAISQFNDEYARVFWIGFRGNYVGLTWDGDTHFHLLKGEIPYVEFNVSIRNAIHSSFSSMRFMETVTGWAGDPNNVNVMAHSLGNLVMWDAVRTYGRYVDLGGADAEGRKAKGLVRNIISNESAVWEETFESENPLDYNSKFKNPPTATQHDQGQYPASVELLNEIYPVDPTGPVKNPKPPPAFTFKATDAEKQHSWRFWLNQKNHNTTVGLSGRPYHSYTRTDYCLNFMERFFDRRYYGTHPLPVGVPGLPIVHLDYHLLRERLHKSGALRSPLFDPNRNKLFLFDVPTLQVERKLLYLFTDLNGASGRIPNPLKNALNLSAIDYGWRASPGEPIKRLAFPEERNHSDFITLPYYQIYRWWDNYLGNGPDKPAGWPKPSSAIPIGDEGR